MPNDAHERAEYDRDLRSLAKGGGLDLLGQLIQQPITLITAAVTARLLGPGGYGLLHLTRRLIDLLSLVFRLGYPSAIVRYISIYEGQGKRRHARGVVVGTVFTSVALGSAAAAVLARWPDPLSVGLYQKPAMNGVLRILALSLPAALAATLLTEATVAKRTMVYRVAGRLLQRVVSLLGIVALCGPLRLGPAGAAFAMLLAWASATVVALTGTVRLLGGVSFSDLHHYDFVQIHIFALPLVLAELSQYGLFAVNPVLGGRWLTERELGMYAAASAVATFGLLGLYSVNMIFRPIIADLHDRGKAAELKEMFQTATRWTYHLTIPPILIAVFKAESILAAFRPEFADGAYVLRILCVGQVVNASVGSAGYVLIMSGYQWLAATNNLAMAVANVVLCVTLTKSYRLWGIALSATFATSGVNLLKAAEVWWLHRISPYTKKVYKPLLAAAITCPMLLIKLQPWWLDLTLPVAGFVVAYIAAIFLLGIDEDDQMVLSLLRRKISAVRERSEQ